MAAARIYRRKWVLVRLPIAVLTVLVCMVLWNMLMPMPPRGITLSSGVTEGAYHADALRYRQAFARSDVELEVVPSEGAEMNLSRLRGQAQPQADLAFVQGGMGPAAGERVNGVRLETIARVALEPVWIFARMPGIDSLEQLQGLRLSLGPRGSGTRKLALAMLAQVRMNLGDIVDHDLASGATAQALRTGTIDAAIIVSSAQSDVVQSLLRDPSIHLVQLRRSAALIERMPWLQLRLLPRGALDTAGKLPSHDVVLLVTTASLVARADLHPALQRLAAEVAREVHTGPGAFHRAGEFPSLRRIEFPASAEARRTLVEGRPWLEEHLPFWWAQVAMRVLAICLPAALAAWWLAHVIPAYLRWVMESRVARWYGELKFIEHDLARESVSGLDRAKYLQRLASIDRRMSEFVAPPDLLARWFTLRDHIAFVRTRLDRAKGR